MKRPFLLMVDSGSDADAEPADRRFASLDAALAALAEPWMTKWASFAFIYELDLDRGGVRAVHVRNGKKA